MIIGVQSWAQTPYQLYKSLLKKGGEDITNLLIKEANEMGFMRPKRPSAPQKVETVERSEAALEAERLEAEREVKAREALEAEEKAAKEEAIRLAKENSEELAARRRRQRGRRSLLATKGGELGVNNSTLN